MEIIIQIGIVLIIILLYMVYNLFRKNEKYEEISELQENHIIATNTLIQSFIEKLDNDPNISFKNDDEIGIYYSQLNQMKEAFKGYVINRNKYA